MLTRIIDRDNCLTPESSAYAKRRLLFALSRFDSRITSVVLTVEDTNGPRGGVDKRCQLLLKLKRSQDIIVSDIDEDIGKCIARVADRAGRAVTRQLKKKRIRRSVRRGMPLGLNDEVNPSWP